MRKFAVHNGKNRRIKRKDPLVDNLMEAGLFKVETTHFAPRGNKVFFIGPVLENGDYLNVIAVVADGQRRIPRLFYGSHSHAAWESFSDFGVRQRRHTL